MEGVFSSTLSFIFNSLAPGRAFSDVVAEVRPGIGLKLGIYDCNPRHPARGGRLLKHHVLHFQLARARPRFLRRCGPGALNTDLLASDCEFNDFNRALSGCAISFYGNAQLAFRECCTPCRHQHCHSMVRCTLACCDLSCKALHENAVCETACARVQAKALGYTEPDPRDDLAGMDVARKVTILAR